MVADPNTGIGEGGEVVPGGGPSHLKDAPGLAREARGRHVGGLLEVALQLVRSEGMELLRGARGGVIRLMKVHVPRVGDEETGREAGPPRGPPKHVIITNRCINETRLYQSLGSHPNYCRRRF